MSDSKAANKDVEMKDETKKEEHKKVEEPTDPFYGKTNLFLTRFRVQEEPSVVGKGSQGERLQDDSIINQII